MLRCKSCRMRHRKTRPNGLKLPQESSKPLERAGGLPLNGDDVVIGNTARSVELSSDSADLGSLTVASNTLTFVNWTTALQCTNVTVRSGGKLALPGRFTEAEMSNRIHIVCVNLTIDPGGAATSGGTNLFQGLAALQAMSPPADNVILLTDGLPTQGEGAPRGRTVSGDRRLKLFRTAVGSLPRSVPINVILLPMEGDPMAASAWWQVAVASGGSFLSPAGDWP